MEYAQFGVFGVTCVSLIISCCYWAIQAGLLTPLTFARHHLSPLAAFTSGETVVARADGPGTFSRYC